MAQPWSYFLVPSRCGNLQHVSTAFLFRDLRQSDGVYFGMLLSMSCMTGFLKLSGSLQAALKFLTLS
jgi:hypothetical protein